MPINHQDFIKNYTSFKFHLSNILPSNIQVTSVGNIIVLDSSYIIIRDKDDLSNFVFGHVESGETLTEALARESIEEAGVSIQNEHLLGYILCNKLKNTDTNIKYQDISIIPIYISFVKKIVSKELSFETKGRELLSYKKARAILEKREDNKQLLNILIEAEEFIKGLYSKLNFDYKGIEILDVPITQVFNFCVNKDSKFCLVRDYGEQHFSLPGGGCELNENFFECCTRETREEAQLEIGEIQIMGVIQLDYLDKNGYILQSVQHVRCCSTYSETKEFVPGKNGFEIEERIFCDFKELNNYVVWLQFDSGKLILENVKNYMSCRL